MKPTLWFVPPTTPAPWAAAALKTLLVHVLHSSTYSCGHWRFCSLTSPTAAATVRDPLLLEFKPVNMVYPHDAETLVDEMDGCKDA